MIKKIEGTEVYEGLMYRNENRVLGVREGSEFKFFMNKDSLINVCIKTTRKVSEQWYTVDQVNTIFNVGKMILDRDGLVRARDKDLAEVELLNGLIDSMDSKDQVALAL